MPKFQPKNNLWKARAKIGRDLIFSSPDLLAQAAAEYFEWVDDNPLKSKENKVVDKAIVEAKLRHMRPYTWSGMCVFFDVNTAYFAQFKQKLNSGDYTSIDSDTTAAFINVIATIENIIYTQKFEAASAGLLNANIISRDLGLADKKEVKAEFNIKDLPIEFS